MQWILTLSLMASLTACSNRQVYEGLKQGSRNECYSRPESQQQECLDKVNQSWEEYQRDREALREKDRK